jgi:hypothetical protein
MQSNKIKKARYINTPYESGDRTDKYLCLVSLCIRFEVGILDNLSLLDIHTLSN